MDFKMCKEMGKPPSAREKVCLLRYDSHSEYVKEMKESVIAPLLSIKGSLLHQAVSAKVPLMTNNDANRMDNSTLSIVHGSHNEPGMLTCDLCFKFYSKWVQTCERARVKLMQETTQQTGVLWQASRKLRLTASTLSKVPRKKDTLPDKFVKSCLFSHFRGNKATNHGKRYEPVARKVFEEQCGVSVVQCGTVVSETHPFLSASPCTWS